MPRRHFAPRKRTGNRAARKLQLLDKIVDPSGLLAYNGVLQEKPVKSLSTLMLFLKAPGRGPTAPIQKLRDGTYAVSRDLLKANLRNPVMPEFSAETASCNCVSDAALEVFIDESGRVTRIRRLGGDPKLLARGEEAIRQWSFEPFRFEGAAVPVRSIVNFLADLAGQVKM